MKFIWIMVFSVFLLVASCTQKKDTNTITIAIGSVGQEVAMLKDAIEQYNQINPDVQIEIFESPPSATDRLGLYLQYLNSNSTDIDIYMIDIIWTGMMANHFVELNDYFNKVELSAHFDNLIENNTVDGRLIAIPWFTDAGILYYRKDLLKKHGVDSLPQTYKELEDIALFVQQKERENGNDSFWGYVWQGNRSESLTCNAIEWQVASQSGYLVSSDSTSNINVRNFSEKLKTVKDWIGTISPVGVTSHAEEEARYIFQEKNALFMRNWSYAWPLLESENSPVQGLVGIHTMPKNISTLGGWQLGVSKYSVNAEQSVDFVKFLTSKEHQLFRARKGNYLPTIELAYSDTAVGQIIGDIEIVKSILANAITRPSSVSKNKYSEVSAAYYQDIHEILTTDNNPEYILSSLDARLENILRGK